MVPRADRRITALLVERWSRAILVVQSEVPSPSIIIYQPACAGTAKVATGQSAECRAIVSGVKPSLRSKRRVDGQGWVVRKVDKAVVPVERRGCIRGAFQGAGNA